MKTDGKTKATIMYRAKSKKECSRILHLLVTISQAPDEWEIRRSLGRVQFIELVYLID